MTQDRAVQWNSSMLIARKYQFAFVHICKNGGNAITAALKPFSTAGYWGGDTEQKHWPAVKIRNELLLEDWDRYFTFAFISNPWRWLHSLYYYFVMTSLLYGSTPIGPELSKWKMWTIKNPGHFTKRWIQEANETAAKSFEKFVTDECNEFLKLFPSGQIRKWLQDEKGQDMVSYIGKYENLGEEWPLLCSRIGVGLVPLSVLNPTILADGSQRAKRDYRKDYPYHLDDLILEAFSIDIDRMRYGKDF
jgi:hypothetical protein